MTELYGDFRRDRPATAVIAVQFTLIDQASARPKVLYERTIGRRITLRKRSPDALAQGYGIGLAEILSQLTTELANSTAIAGGRENRSSR